MNILSSIRDTLTNPYLWIGLIGLTGVSAVLYVVVDNVVMPSFTRYEVSVQVPDVMSLPSEQADSLLSEAGLRMEEVILRKPNLPRDVVIDQNQIGRAHV